MVCSERHAICGVKNHHGRRSGAGAPSAFPLVMVRLGATMHSASSWTLANGAQVDLQVHSLAWIRLQCARCSELWADSYAQVHRRGQMLQNLWTRPCVSKRVWDKPAYSKSGGMGVPDSRAHVSPRHERLRLLSVVWRQGHFVALCASLYGMVFRASEEAEPRGA
eukprot:4467289-Amphidinium_carterae.1